MLHRLFSTLLLICISYTGIAQYQLAADHDPDRIPYLQNGLYGFSDKEGKLLIPAQFESVQAFNSEGYAKVVKDGLSGILHTNGQFVVPPFVASGLSPIEIINTDEKEPAIVKNAYLVFDQKSKRWCFFRPGNTTTSPLYYPHDRKILSGIQTHWRPRHQNAQFRYGLKKVVLKDSSVNFIDTLGNLLLPKNVYDARILSPHLLAFGDRNKNIALADYSGQLLTDYIFQSISKAKGKPYFIIGKKDSTQPRASHLTGLFDEYGREILPLQYRGLKFLSGTLFSTSDRSNSLILNIKGDTVKRFDEEIPEALIPGFIKTRNGAKNKLWTEHLQPVSTWDFDQLISNYTCPYAGGIIGDSLFIYHPSGALHHFIPDAQFRLFPGNKDSQEVVLKHDKKGAYLIDAKGKAVFDRLYTEIEPLNFQRAYYVSDIFQGGVYDLDKGWILPISPRFIKVHKSNYSIPGTISVEYNKAGKRYRLEKDFSSTDLGNYEPENTHRFSLSLSDDDSKKTFTLSDGTQFVYDGEERIQLTFKEDRVFFHYKKERKKYYLNDQMQAIFPEGFYQYKDFSFIPAPDSVHYLFVATNKTSIGIVKENGEWLIPPIEGALIRSPAHGFLPICANGQCDLYTTEGKKVNTSPAGHFKIIAPNCIIVSQKSSEGNYNYIADGNLRQLQDQHFKSLSTTGPYLHGGTEDPLNQSACLYDYSGNTIRCMPYREIIATADPQGRFIVNILKGRKKLYGLADSLGQEIIPCQYQKIRYVAPFFILQKEGYSNEILNTKNEISAKNLMGFIEMEKDRTPAIYYANGQEHWYVLDARGALLHHFTNRIHLLGEKQAFQETMFYQMDENRKRYYVDKLTGKKYKE